MFNKLARMCRVLYVIDVRDWCLNLNDQELDVESGEHQG